MVGSPRPKNMDCDNWGLVGSWGIRTCIHLSPCVIAGMLSGVRREGAGGDILGGYSAGP